MCNPWFRSRSLVVSNMSGNDGDNKPRPIDLGADNRDLDSVLRPRFDDQAFETFCARLRPLRADYPPGCEPPVAGRLGLKKIPRCTVPPEFARVGDTQLCRLAVFECVSARFIFLAARGGRNSGRLHPTFPRKNSDAGDVDGAPDAFGTPRRETDLVTLVIDFLADAIDPAKAKCFVD